MAKIKPIRIGDTLERTYTIRDNQVPPQPIDLTGITIKFCVHDGKTLHQFGTGTGVTVTPLTGTVVIELEKEQTVLFSAENNASSYLDLSYADGNHKSKAQVKEVIAARGAVV